MSIMDLPDPCKTPTPHHAVTAHETPLFLRTLVMQALAHSFGCDRAKNDSNPHQISRFRLTRVLNTR
jgi:hypothetical protein